MNEYPREDELITIGTWNVTEKPVRELLNFVEGLWKWPDWGFKLTGKNVLRLELHTGGWSGNEELIGALKQNYLFWSMCWLKSTRGGHYWFKIPKSLVKGDRCQEHRA